VTQPNQERRTFFSDTRNDWNPFIYQMLKYIDKLQEYYIRTGNPFYEQQSQKIRKIIKEHKQQIHELEGFDGPPF
jgi:archaellum component FlaC